MQDPPSAGFARARVCDLEPVTIEAVEHHVAGAHLPNAMVLFLSVEADKTEINGVPMNSYIEWMRSCYYISITGLPTISVPWFSSIAVSLA